MKILLIRPDISNISSGYKLNDGRMEPLPLGILAGLTPEDVEVVLRDERVEELSFDEPADLVAISVDTFVARRAYAIADEFRRRGVRVVLGGILNRSGARSSPMLLRVGCGRVTGKSLTYRKKRSSPAGRSSRGKGISRSLSCSSHGGVRFGVRSARSHSSSEAPTGADPWRRSYAKSRRMISESFSSPMTI
jgi:hypothetical protein